MSARASNSSSGTSSAENPSARAREMNRSADPSEPDDAERLARKFGADERLAFPVTGPYRRDGARGVAHEREHQHEGLFGRGERVGAWCVEDDDAGVSRRGDVDRVDADAGACDDRKLRAESQERPVDLRLAANDQTVGVGERRGERARRLADNRDDNDSRGAQDVDPGF
jgi:hypothetical protein